MRPPAARPSSMMLRMFLPSEPGTRDRLAGLIAGGIAAVVALRLSLPTIDAAYLIRAGDVMLETGHLLRTDRFTFTIAGEPWLNQQWLAEVIFAAIHRAGGWELIAIARAAAAGAASWLVYRACRERGEPPARAALLVTAGLAVSTYGLGPRPQLLGVVLWAATLWIVARRDAHPRGLWAVPPIVAIWANVHGTFPLAVLLLVWAYVEDRRRTPTAARATLVVVGVTGLATLLSPFGPEVWTYVVSIVTDPEVRAVSEWRPPSPFTFAGARVTISIALVAIVVWRARRDVPLPRVVVLALLATIAAASIRGVAWWTLAAPVLIADLLPRPDRPRRALPLLIPVAAMVALVGLVLTSLPWMRPTYASTANAIDAGDGLLALAPHRFSTLAEATFPPGSRLFVAQAWASWFELETPGLLVMVDPRIELFPTAVWDDYHAVSDGADGWRAIVDRWRIDGLVLSRLQQSPLIDVLAEDGSGWVEVYADDDGVLLTRG